MMTPTSEPKTVIEVTPSWWHGEWGNERIGRAVGALVRFVVVKGVEVTPTHLSVGLPAVYDGPAKRHIEAVRRTLLAAVEAVGPIAPPQAICPCGARAGFTSGADRACFQVDGVDVCPDCYQKAREGQRSVPTITLGTGGSLPKKGSCL